MRLIKLLRVLLKISLILIMTLSLIDCARSVKTAFYILNPIPLQKKITCALSPNLKIGIESVITPAYLLKPEIIIYTETNALSLEENHQWAETLDKSIPRIIAANLSVLLPGAVIETAPWDFKFKPEYILKLNVIEFGVNQQGDSVLRAELLIYHLDNIIKKQEIAYCIHTIPFNINSLVSSMNENLTHLSEDIARIFR